MKRPTLPFSALLLQRRRRPTRPIATPRAHCLAGYQACWNHRYQNRHGVIAANLHHATGTTWLPDSLHSWVFASGLTKQRLFVHALFPKHLAVRSKLLWHAFAFDCNSLALPVAIALCARSVPAYDAAYGSARPQWTLTMASAWFQPFHAGIHVKF